jgi:hypothetical protein
MSFERVDGSSGRKWNLNSNEVDLLLVLFIFCWIL